MAAETKFTIASPRLPPQNIEAEQSVLGSLMLDRDAIIKTADILWFDDFYYEKNALIFKAMLDLYEQKSSIDVLTVSNRLSELGKLETVGGSSYLTELVNAVPSAAHVVHYAQIVKRKGTLRKLISVASDITNLAYDEEEDLDSVLDTAENKLFSVSQKYLHQNFIPLSTALHDTFERIDELHREKGKLRGITTGFVDLDRLLGGLQKSDLIILASRPSMGKTTLALDMARNAAHAGIGVGIFSLEMSRDQLVDRLLASEAGIDMWKMRTGRLSEEGENNDFTKIQHAMGRLAELPIFIDDSAASNVMEIRTKARRLQSESEIGLLVVDYLQLMQGISGTDNRVQEVSEISRHLKSLARELNVPVLAISQLSRAPEQRSPPIPLLSDLRESGSLEQDADVVMFIYREDYYKGADARRPNVAQILIKKHRNGPTGDVELYFESEKVTFHNLAKEAPLEGPASNETELIQPF